MKYSINTIKQLIYKLENPKYLFFWGHQLSKNGKVTKSCLSQWWMSTFTENGNEFYSAEQYMMFQKAKLFDDLEIMNQIIAEHDPKKVKSLGRKVKNFDPNKWDSHKYEIVLQGNTLKFSQNDKLKDFLIGTGETIIVEASPVDKIWGIGMAESNTKINNPQYWKGENLLGFALMETRDFLIANN